MHAHGNSVITGWGKKDVTARRSRTLIVVAMATSAALLAGVLVPSDAVAKRRTRVVQKAYETPFLAVGEGGVVHCGIGVGCVGLTPRRGERYISVELDDASGTPSFGFVFQDVDGDGYDDGHGYFCGKTESPYRVVPHIRIVIYILLNEPECPNGVGTRGTVIATFSNKPSS